MDLTGRCALVTGSGRGIGRAIAMGLAEHGARVVVADVDTGTSENVAAEIKSLGGESMPIAFDVTSLESVAQGDHLIRDEWGDLDILVNNAGWDKVEPFLESSPETWERVIRINLMGVIHTCRTFLPAMVARKSGVIVNIGSDAGRVGSTGEAVYSAAKGGVIAFTKTLARETSGSGVRVNCVCPGPTDTPLLHEQVGNQPKLIAALERAIPMGRLGLPQDVASVVVFMASNYAAFMTGQTLSVSGGLTMA
jgi:2-hydroxycyclohexanecarboxyl-CoA dehydrogenase